MVFCNAPKPKLPGLAAAAVFYEHSFVSPLAVICVALVG